MRWEHQELARTQARPYVDDGMEESRSKTAFYNFLGLLTEDFGKSCQVDGGSTLPGGPQFQTTRPESAHLKPPLKVRGLKIKTLKLVFQGGNKP